MRKPFDAAWFQHWYHAHRIQDAAALRRKVALALAQAEWFLERPVRSVLDVGCGEGLWRAELRKLRPNLHYLGLDGSDYAVARYGRTRNLHRLDFVQLADVRPCPSVDLLVCADVLHYLSARDLQRGLRGFAELCHGVAFIEVYCRGDAIEGDLDGFIARPASHYRKALGAHGFVQCGPHTWLSPAIAGTAMALERL